MSEVKRKQMNGRDNVFIETYTVNAVTEERVCVGKFWEPVILWLADNFPKWKFVGTHLRGAGADEVGDFIPWRWTVSVDDEDLGKLTRDYYGNKPCYAIENERIANKRERGWAQKTVKVDNARKIVMKNFRPKDLKELIHETVRKVHGAVAYESNQAEGSYLNDYRKLTAHLHDHLMSNIDKYAGIAEGYGYANKQNLVDKYEDYKIKGSIESCKQKKMGAAVLIHGNTYAVYQDDDHFYTCESATLPDLLKRRVGMLKLLENEQTLINVGYRQSETEFYVSLEEDNGAT